MFIVKQIIFSDSNNEDGCLCMMQLGLKQKVKFLSKGNNVSLLFTGPLDVMEIAKVCSKVLKSVQHTYLVDVSERGKDRYRTKISRGSWRCEKRNTNKEST